MYFFCCKLLGVEPGSGPETIKSAYRKSAKELHPDVNTSDKAQYCFVIMQNAYEYLLNHPYTKDDVQILLERKKQVRKDKMARYFYNAQQKNTSSFSRYSLREIMDKSLLVRIVFISFHILFIAVGLNLVIRPVYNMVNYSPEEGVNILSAYLTLFFGFLLGILITIIFLISGIAFLRRR